MLKKSINVAEVDHDTIRDELKNYLKGQTEFKDHDFNGSAMSTLIDILSQNAYQMAFYGNMIANESFLDTAIRRENVVSRAKMLGYTPRSRRSATAEIEVRIIPNDSPSSITIFKGARFQTTIDGSTFTFVTDKDWLIYPDNSGNYVRTIKVKEGYDVTYTYVHDVQTPPKYTILDPNVDTSSLVVRVRENELSTDVSTFTLIDDLTEVNGDSLVYFLEENLDSNYEVLFGDGVLGKALVQDNYVTLSCRICTASAPNGANVFRGVGNIARNTANALSLYTASSLRTVTAAGGGMERESIDSIRFNAPKNYTMQRRNVTVNDYEQFLLNAYSDIQAVSVWGGEMNIPAVYGRCFLSVKPADGYTITTIRKLEIIEQLKRRNVLTIEPTIVDPNFTFIKPSIRVRFDPRLTTLGADGVASKVAETVIGYEASDLSTFNKTFRSSRLTALIDDSDDSILSNEMSVLLEKRMTPRINENVSYTLIFNAPALRPYTGYLGALSSTNFTTTLTADDCSIEDDGNGLVNLISTSTGTKRIVKANIGTIDYTTGIIRLNQIIITAHDGPDISIFMQPRVLDYTPVRNMIVLISAPRIEMFDDVKQEVVYVGTAETEGSTNIGIQDVTNVLL